MSPSKSIKRIDAYGITTFCDDIRNEFGGRYTYVGAYENEMLLTEIPALLPKLGLAIHIVIPKSDKNIEKLDLKIYFPGDEIDSPTIDVPLNIDAVRRFILPKHKDADVPPHAKMMQQIILSPVRINQEGMFKVRLDFNEYKIKCGVLRVRKVDVEELKKRDYETIRNMPS